jgi:outer membrane protein assembly factor BamB
VPNDFKDWDSQLSLVAATARGVPAIIGGGKMGNVYAMNGSTGALLWKLPTTTNSPIAITSNAILVPAGAPAASAGPGLGRPQLVAYTVH